MTTAPDQISGTQQPVKVGSKDGHDRIWLEPKAKIYGSEGRMWCEDNVWDDEGVEYLRATPVRAAAPDLYEAIAFVVDQMQQPRNSSHTLADYLHGTGFEMMQKALARAGGAK